MSRHRLSHSQQMTRLIGGGILTGIALGGGFRNRAAKTTALAFGGAALLEGLVGQHLAEFFRLGKVE